MKKIIVIFIAIFLLSSCGEKNENIRDIDNLEKIKLEVVNENKEEENKFEISFGEKNNEEKSIKIYNTSEVSKIIYKYYNLISKNNFYEAYVLKYKPKYSIEKFRNDYSKNGKMFIHITSGTKIKELGNNIFLYNISIFYKNVFKEEYFEVKQEIIDGKLNLISVKEIKNHKTINNKIISYGNIKSYIEFDNGESKLILEENGNKKVVYKSGYKYGTKGEFDYLDDYLLWYIGIPQFTNNGKVLEFNKPVWESSNKLFYIIDSGITIESSGILSLYGFTKDEKYFYLCGLDGMGGSNKFEIYDTTDWKIIKKLLENKGDHGICKEYNIKGNYLLYSKYSDNGDGMYKYFFDENKIISIKQ